jgi:glutathione S-transferase
MLTIYHVPRTRSLRVVWLCEEMGLPYEVRLETFGQPSAEFLEANPLGAFPAIRDGDVVMGESTAIMQYLTETYGPTKLALKPGHPRFADYLQFVTFGEASLSAYMNPVIATMFGAPDGQKENFTVEAAKGMFIRRLGALEKKLDEGDYLAGDFTAADISVGYALGLGEGFGLGERYSAPVKAYSERLKARPAFQAAAAK